MMFVSELLNAKRSEQHTEVAPNIPLYKVASLLSRSAHGALVVVEEDRLLGLLTKSSVEQCRAVYGPETDLLTVREVMESGIPVVNTEDTVDECMAVMLERSAPYVPVISEGRFEGIITIADVVRSALREKEFMISQLVGYITESRGNTEHQYAYV